MLSEARQALGGDASRASITSFKITGLIKSSNRLESGSFEIVCTLPDKFVQVEHRAIINPGQTVSEPSSRPTVRHQATRLGFNSSDLIFQPHVITASNLTLGLFAESFVGVPLHFNEATGPDAEHSVQVTGPDVTGTLTFNAQTRLPERFGRMRYDDYRDVGGRKVPFRITDGLDEWIVREFLVNVDVGDKTFKPTTRGAIARSE